MKAAAEAEILEQSKRIEFYLTEYSLELLASKMHSGDFLVPAYQRISVNSLGKQKESQNSSNRWQWDCQFLFCFFGKWMTVS
jgi:hypothetical protein